MATIHKFVKVGELSLEKFQEIFAETIVGKDRLPESLSSRRDDVIQRACAGYPQAAKEAVKLITDFMELNNINIEGLTNEKVAWEVYKSVWSLDRLPESLSSRRDAIMQRACAGYPEVATEAVKLITDFMELYSINIEGLTNEKAAWEVYKSVWGLDRLEDLYNDPGLQEIAVNGPDHIHVLRKKRKAPNPINHNKEGKS
ncbi:hypothetical protein DCCM_3063 [Desulfocucumis palustris]|uniref:Uncharacterized protein n=1 Tax=Desulfocucumis palustris TaxID=1898651 RepID=A0A2L2XCV3_9FIRM|nr:hypothetical protein [Desulfocucumis palustris]GBF33952.1 hypothetical protein DCCM_3063 [Desulfocucumis palustris]